MGLLRWVWPNSDYRLKAGFQIKAKCHIQTDFRLKTECHLKAERYLKTERHLKNKCASKLIYTSKLSISPEKYIRIDQLYKPRRFHT